MCCLWINRHAWLPSSISFRMRWSSILTMLPCAPCNRISGLGLTNVTHLPCSLIIWARWVHVPWCSIYFSPISGKMMDGCGKRLHAIRMWCLPLPCAPNLRAKNRHSPICMVWLGMSRLDYRLTTGQQSNYRWRHLPNLRLAMQVSAWCPCGRTGMACCVDFHYSTVLMARLSQACLSPHIFLGHPTHRYVPFRVVAYKSAPLTGLRIRRVLSISSTRAIRTQCYPCPSRVSQWQCWGRPARNYPQP